MTMNHPHQRDDAQPDSSNPSYVRTGIVNVQPDPRAAEINARRALLTTSQTQLRSGGTLYTLQSGQVCEYTPPSTRLPYGLWRLFSSKGAWLTGSNPVAETRTEPTHEFFRSNLP